MADGDSTNISEVMGAINDAVVNPVKDEIGKMIEEGASALSGTNDPQALQRRQQQEMEQKQKDAQKAAHVRDFLSKLSEEEQKARQSAAQREQAWVQKNQAEEQKEQVKKFEVDKKEASVNQAVYNAERTKEQRNGVGG